MAGELLCHPPVGDLRQLVGHLGQQMICAGERLHLTVPGEHLHDGDGVSGREQGQTVVERLKKRPEFWNFDYPRGSAEPGRREKARPSPKGYFRSPVTPRAVPFSSERWLGGQPSVA